MQPEVPERDFQEWVDAYWAKDIQELFRLERRHSFQKFFELLMARSGGIFEATSFARPCEVSRTTLSNYLRALEETHVVQVIRPFSSHRPTEIVSAPKVYAFDTGFTCHYRGIAELRHDDLGLLWEHFVLNEVQARLQTRRVHYWRDKRGHEVDFVLTRRGKPPLAIECKWSQGDLDPAGLQAFRRQYPKAELYLVARDADRSHQKTLGEAKVTFIGLPALLDTLLASAGIER
jgi:predicted AAA+ superfamily ATPase